MKKYLIELSATSLNAICIWNLAVYGDTLTFWPRVACWVIFWFLLKLFQKVENAYEN